MPNSTPTADRPKLPSGYRIPETTEGMLEWEIVKHQEL